MNTKDRHEIGGARKNDLVFRVQVPCSLSRTGTHAITIASSLDNVLMHMSAECCDDAIAQDAIDRIGGECCTAAFQQVRNHILGGGTGRIAELHSSFKQHITALSDHVSLTHSKRREVVEEAERDDPSKGKNSRQRNWAALMTKKVRAATGISLRISWYPESWARGVDGERVKGPPFLALEYDTSPLARRVVGTYGWTFDDIKMNHLLTRSMAPFSHDAYVDRDEHAGKGSYCTVCDTELRQRKAHLKSHKHQDNMRKHIRTAMRMFPGLRSN